MGSINLSASKLVHVAFGKHRVLSGCGPSYQFLATWDSLWGHSQNGIRQPSEQCGRKGEKANRRDVTVVLEANFGGVILLLVLSSS